MNRLTCTQRGFTIIEVTVVIAVLSLALGLFTRNFVRAQGFAEHERARMRNIVDQQESLRSLEVILQAADRDTLAGFDVSGLATAPAFRRWLHDPATGVQLGVAERLEWEANGDAVGDLTSPGRIVLVSAGNRIPVVDRVPSGGFSCQLDGRRLLIHLETFYPVNAKEVSRMATDTAVFLGRKDG